MTDKPKNEGLAYVLDTLRRVLMDYVPDNCDEGCQCSAAQARRLLYSINEHDVSTYCFPTLGEECGNCHRCRTDGDEEEFRIVVSDVNGTPWKSWTFIRRQMIGDVGRVTVADLLAEADKDNSR